MTGRFLWILRLAAAFLVVLASIATLNTAKAQGNTYYVATNGNDFSPGTQSQPWKTIQKAADTLQAGDTVLVREGTYFVPNSVDGGNEIRPKNSGTSSAYITYKAYPGEKVIIKGNYATVGDSVWYGISIAGQNYIIIDGFTIQGFHAGIGCKAPGHHIIIRNNELKYNSESGVSSTHKVSGTQETCDYMTIEDNVIHHNGYYEDGTPATRKYEGWGSGITINAHQNPYKYDKNYSHFHSIIRRNYIYHNYDGTGGDLDNDPDHTDGNGIILDMTGDMPPILIENNIIFDNGGRCFTWKYVQNFWFVGNTCYRNTWDTLTPHPFQEIYGDSRSTTYPLKNAHILNNIIYALSTDRPMIKVDGSYSSSEFDVRNNVLYNGRSYIDGTNVIKSDPLLVNLSTNPSTADFRLKSTSPAIDSGTSDFRISGVQAYDYYGTPRPQGSNYDLGAYEFLSSQPPTPTPTPTPKPGDITGDGKIDEADYAILIANFGKTGGRSQGDLTGDGKINEADYAVLIANFGK